ncbi:PTS sugar transporter subunit IIA, partial [Glaesserella parasuis]|nr:PTS sugar transporter subunit IIA [Glaesserella parasuis]
DIIYAIFFSEKICVEYKDSLREIAQQLSDKNLLKHLRAALSREEIWQILSYYDYSVNKNLESRNVMWN